MYTQVCVCVCVYICTTMHTLPPQNFGTTTIFHTKFHLYRSDSNEILMNAVLLFWQYHIECLIFLKRRNLYGKLPFLRINFLWKKAEVPKLSGDSVYTILYYTSLICVCTHVLYTQSTRLFGAICFRMYFFFGLLPSRTVNRYLWSVSRVNAV